MMNFTKSFLKLVDHMFSKKTVNDKMHVCRHTAPNLARLLQYMIIYSTSDKFIQ